jgi:hypothetical protein
MDEGTDARPLTVEDVAVAVREAHNLDGDFLRAAYQIEGHEDRRRGAVLLAEEAIKVLCRSKVAEPRGEGYVWVGGDRLSITTQGRKLKLFTREERELNRLHGRMENQRLANPFADGGLPKRGFDPEKEENKALIENLRLFGYDDDFPILVDYEGNIVDGRNRAAACELVGIDWRDHTKVMGYAEITKEAQPLKHIDAFEKAIRANIGVPLSTATKAAIAREMREAGYTTKDVAERLQVTPRHVQRIVSAMPNDTMSSGIAKPRRISDEEAVSILMEVLERYPDSGILRAGTLMRDRYNVQIGNPRVEKLIPVAKSRLATKAEPPVETPPQVETGIAAVKKPKPDPEPETEPLAPSDSESNKNRCPTCGQIILVGPKEGL